jgi:anti-sigma factor RsiW
LDEKELEGGRFFMKHFTHDEWLKYVRNEINEKSRNDFESHLYECDHCLNLYLQAVEESESSLPILSNETTFTDLVMVKVTKEKQTTAEPSHNNKKPFYKQALFHYFLAAAATILLMVTGAFHSIAAYAGAIESSHFQEKQPSVTEGVINKTFAWIDSIEKKEVDKK